MDGVSIRGVRPALALACCSAAILSLWHALRRHRRRRLQDAVLRFWFDGDATTLYTTRWFVQPSSSAQQRLDAAIGEEFGETIARAERRELHHWANTARGTLALILVLDQFSRHVHRQ